MHEPLDEEENARWTAWKRATAAVDSALERDIAARSGLSVPDFSVLTRIVELGDGSLRQQELATLLGWKRSRLSRQLARMEVRGLLTRSTDGPARLVSATDEGRSLVAAARPAHAAAVRRALLAAVPDSGADAFWAAVRSIGEAGR